MENGKEHAHRLSSATRRRTRANSSADRGAERSQRPNFDQSEVRRNIQRPDPLLTAGSISRWRGEWRRRVSALFLSTSLALRNRDVGTSLFPRGPAGSRLLSIQRQILERARTTW